MPFPTRFIHTAGNIPAAPPPELSRVDSDVFTTLAALLCAVICILGLSFAARCVWMRRSSVDPPSRSLQNKGLKKKVLKRLPKAIFSTASSGKIADCAICLAEFSDGEEIRVLPECCHVFHLRCVDTWFGSHSSCPSCRHVLVAATCRNSGSLPATEAGSGGRKWYEGDEHRFLP